MSTATPYPPGAPGHRSIDFSEFIDAQPVGRFHIRLLLLCAAVLFADGFDTQAIGYVAPDLSREWQLSRGALGPAFSAGLFGLMLGALILGPIADRSGRRRIILWSTAAFSIGSVLTIFARDLQWLIVIRFLTGIGLGGAMPNAVALMSEFSPRRRRATMVMAMFCGFSIGAAIGGLVSAVLIPTFGWRSVFAAGGVVPLLALPILARGLPESARFLSLRGGRAQLAQLLARIAPAVNIPADTNIVVREEKASARPVAQLFSERRALMTVLLWVVFFMSLLDLYLLSNWLPTVLSELGVSISMSAAIGAMLQVGGVIGAFALGSLIDRFSFRALACIYFLAAIAIVCIGYARHSIPLVTFAIACAGFCIVGGQTASNALAATYYPSAIRSTGVGWALGIGRVGSIIGPLAAGVMLARQAGVETLFLAASVPALCACAAAFGLSGIARSQGPAPHQ